MGIEIERKFLVTGDGWRTQAHKRIAMRHGYLTPQDGPASVRVRVEGDVGKLNVKQAIVGMSRAESRPLLERLSRDEFVVLESIAATQTDGYGLATNWDLPRVVDGVKCVIVNEALRDLEPMAWDFVMHFARDNALQVQEWSPPD